MSADTPQPTDPIWTAFEDSERQSQEDAEKAYQEVEDWNSVLLYQVAGVQDPKYTFVKKLKKEGEDEIEDGLETSETPPWVPTNITNSLMYLRPDTRKKLHEQGESDEVIYSQGDPYIVIGDVPPRTQKLIDDLLAATSAVHDEEHSTAEDEIWLGDVAGQPIRIVKIHGVRRLYPFEGDVKESPTLSIRIYRENHPGLEPDESDATTSNE